MIAATSRKKRLNGLAGSPAQRAGLSAGDQLVALDGLRITAQIRSRPTSVLLGFELSQNPFSGRPTYRKIAHLPFAERVALLRQGASGLYANAQVSAAQREQAGQLLSAVGIALWLDDEAQIDAVTAVSGSGPAYFFLLMQAMTDAGEKLGLSRETASRLTLQTAFGAAQMALSSEVEPAELRRRVTSPNGTTEAAIKSFQANGFEALVEQALNAASQRSAELAEQLGQ